MNLTRTGRIARVGAAADSGPIAPGAGDTIAQVITRMEQIDGGLPRKDGVAYFNRLHLQVTKAVQGATASVTFADPTFTERLDVVFAGLYFAAEATLGTGESCPVAWRPLIQERAATARSTPTTNASIASWGRSRARSRAGLRPA